MSDPNCTTDACATNMGLIHLQAGDLVSAYRYFEPLAEQGEVQAIEHIIDVCQRAGDIARAEVWRQRIAATAGESD